MTISVAMLCSVDSLLSVIMTFNSSLIHGPSSPPLWNVTLGELIERQADHLRDKIQLGVPYQATRLSFKELSERSQTLAKAFLASGLKHGDHIGIFAGNRYE